MPALKPATIGQKFLTDCGQNRPLTTLAIAVAVSGAFLVFILWAHSDGKFDFPMIITMLVSMILIVWVADRLVFVGWNLVIVWLLVQFFVIVGRGIFENIS